jgi:hypothetical protein
MLNIHGELVSIWTSVFKEAVENYPRIKKVVLMWRIVKYCFLCNRRPSLIKYNPKLAYNVQEHICQLRDWLLTEQREFDYRKMQWLFTSSILEQRCNAAFAVQFCDMEWFQDTITKKKSGVGFRFFIRVDVPNALFTIWESFFPSRSVY